MSEAFDLDYLDGPAPWPDYLDADEIVEELWFRGDLEFLLWPQQLPIWRQLQNLPVSVELFVCLCARQYGKSTLGAVYALSEAIKNRDCCILVMGPDTKQVCDIFNSKMRFLIRSAPPGLIVQSKTHNRWYVYHDLDPRALDYTEIVLSGMNENSSSQRGKTVHKILIEEVVDVREDDYITSVRSDLGPALTHSKDGKIIYLTTLPKQPGHPFITETLPQARLKDAVAVFDIHTNTALTPEQFQKCLDLAGGEDSDDWKREYLCQVVRDQRLMCLPDFSPDSICSYALPHDGRNFVTIDWGGVRDKTVAILHSYDTTHGKDLFWDERVFPANTSTKTIVEELRRMEAGVRIDGRFIDGPQQLVSVDLIQDFKYFARLPQKSDWEASLNTLNGRFKAGKILIHPRMKFFAVSAEQATLNKLRTDFDRTEALGHMDAIAAGMYAVRMRDTTPLYGAGKDYVPVNGPHMLGTNTVDPRVKEPKRFGTFRKLWR